MKKIYLFNYSDSTGSREQIKKWLDDEDLVDNWRYDLPHCFYLISDASAQTLSKSFVKFNGNKGRHLITEITANRQGLLTKKSWTFMRMRQFKKEPLKATDLIYINEYSDDEIPCNKENENHSDSDLDKKNKNEILNFLNSLTSKNKGPLTQKVRRVCEWIIYEHLPEDIITYKDIKKWISENYKELSKKYPYDD